MEELKRVNINVRANEWERFKKIAKYKESDASKEIRKFIQKYLSENSQLFLKIERGEKWKQTA